VGCYKNSNEKEEVETPTFMVMSRHSPENCGAYNEKARKVFLQLLVSLMN